MEIDKEYLDQQFKASRDYLDQKLDEKLSAQTKELKEYVHDSFEVQQHYIDERIGEVIKGMKFSVDLNH